MIMAKTLGKNEEVRYLQTTEMRADRDEGDKRKIVGYALKFGTWSEDLGGFIETIDSTALDRADMSDVRALFDHDPQMIIGRTKAGTLQLWKDEIGLRFECELSDTSYSRDLYENILNGNVDQCSFGFILDNDGDEWRFDESTNLYRRTLKRIKRLMDVSVVTFPAYQDTAVAPALRNLKSVEDEKNRMLDKEKLKIELDLLS